ncbi:ATP-dependent DNA helicase PIF1-like protein [Tanacetum coccineum]
MPYPNNEYMVEGNNRLIYDETSYNKDELKEQHQTLYGSLITKQKGIYSTVMDVVDKNKGGMFFVYGYVSTGKTYIYKIMFVALRSQVEDSMCHIPADSDLADLTRQAKLIIRDEAPMIQLGSGSTESGKKEIQDFANWILDIGNGKIGGKNEGESIVVFPDRMLILEFDDYVGSIIDETYPYLLQNVWNPVFFQERVILAPTHEMVDMINERMLDLIPRDETLYESSDFVSLADADTNFDKSIYTTYFLNGLRMSGLPHHAIKLNIGTLVMLMRNIDQKAILCNRTRLQVLIRRINVTEAKIIPGGNVGRICAIPRMVITPPDTKMPLKLNRRQFPVQVCFGMTINKSQGQTLSQVGLFLPKSVFSHGQLYVAFSRVKSKRGLKVLYLDKDDNYSNSTINVVYKEVLCRI